MDIEKVEDQEINILNKEMNQLKINESLILQKNPAYKNINSSNTLNAYYY